MRPKLEYSSTTWNPQQVTQKRQIEQAQRNAARFVSNKPFNYQNPTSVTFISKQLNWQTLEDRRRSSDLVLLYKVVHNVVAVPITYHPPKSPRYMECVRFITYHCHVNVYQHSFFPRTVTLWNQLPESTINQESLDSFKLAVT